MVFGGDKLELEFEKEVKVGEFIEHLSENHLKLRKTLFMLENKLYYSNNHLIY